MIPDSFSIGFREREREREREEMYNVLYRYNLKLN